MNYLKNIKKILLRFLYFKKKVGIFNALWLIIYEVKREGILSIRLKGYRHPIALRTNTSDIATFEQIFIRRDYDIAIDSKPEFIIDGGAYIGLSAIYFANRFPEAKIIAVEPAGINYEMLKRNTSKYNNITTFNAALWSERKSLAVKDEGLGEWGFLIKEVDDSNLESIDGITIEDLLGTSGFTSIDILKLDVEGSEVELLSENYENWLSKVKVMIIELHENLRPGCKEVFLKATKPYDFAYSTSGENEVLISNILK